MVQNIAVLAGIIFAVVTSLLIIGNIIQFLFKVFFSSINFSHEKVWLYTHKQVPDRLRERYEPVLLRRFTYYRRLSQQSRQRFLFRLSHFIRCKTFSGRKELQVTDEMKTLISASAIQLTFGLDNYLMDRFSEIIIYPDIFPAPGGKYYRGETSLRGVMAFSWKHFVEGYDIEDDKYNLGLHEMAHALEFSGLMDGPDEYFTQNLYKWSSIARAEYENVHNERASILRSYAGTNVHEFFAVCVEHFFEASAEFKERLPEIYHWLCLTLRQDPLLTIESYAANLQRISNEMPERDYTPLPDFNTHFHLGRLTLQTVLLLMVWSVVLATFISGNQESAGFMIYPVLLYSGILLLRLSYTYTIFETYSHHLVLRRPMHFNRRHAVAYENITRIEFTPDEITMIRIFYIDRGNILSIEKYFSVSEDEISELKKRLRAKGVLIKG